MQTHAGQCNNKEGSDYLLCVMPCHLGLQLGLAVKCMLPFKVAESSL